jgi:hypothetical protein
MVVKSKSKEVPLHAMEALEGTADIAPTHSRPRHKMIVHPEYSTPIISYLTTGHGAEPV